MSQNMKQLHSMKKVMYSIIVSMSEHIKQKIRKGRENNEKLNEIELFLGFEPATICIDLKCLLS